MPRVDPCGGAFPPRFRRDFDARPNRHATSVSGWRENRGFRLLFSGFSEQFSLVASDVTCLFVGFLTLFLNFTQLIKNLCDIVFGQGTVAFL